MDAHRHARLCSRPFATGIAILVVGWAGLTVALLGQFLSAKARDDTQEPTPYLLVSREHWRRDQGRIAICKPPARFVGSRCADAHRPVRTLTPEEFLRDQRGGAVQFKGAVDVAEIVRQVEPEVGHAALMIHFKRTPCAGSPGGSMTCGPKA